MGSPKKNPGNFVENIGASINRGVQDYGKGLEQVVQGNVGKGLNNMLAGTAGIGSVGMSEKIGLVGQTTQEINAQTQAAEEQQVIKDQAVATEDARLKAIQTSIEEQVNTRLRTPGRSQTLLGSGTLNPTGNNTLLTMGKSKR